MLRHELREARGGPGWPPPTGWPRSPTATTCSPSPPSGPPTARPRTPRSWPRFREAFEARAYSAEISGDFDDEPTEIRFTSLDDLLTEALVAARPAFAAAPVAPVDDLLAAAGLATSDGDVIDATTSWDDLDRWRGRRRIESMFDLEGSEVDEAEMLLTASYGLIEGRLRLDDFGADDPESPGAEAAAFALALCLVKDRVARAFVGEHRAAETPPHELADFARMLLEHLDAPEDTGVRFVLAWALNERGDTLGAEAELEQAARGGVDHAPMLRMLAGYRADRGDAPGAMALLRRIPAAIAESDGNVELLRDEVEGYARNRPAPIAGRNEPCPCGSGRKYKTCHLGQERHPLDERAPWLYAKAVRYLRDGPSRFLSAEVATMIAEYAEGSPGSLLELLDLPLTHDIALHEGRVFADFVTERDAFLPDDEALTAAGWALVDRSVFEIESKGDDSIGLRDLRSGEQIEVVNVNASDATRIGDLVLGRPLPVGDTWQRVLRVHLGPARAARPRARRARRGSRSGGGRRRSWASASPRRRCRTPTATTSCSTISSTRWTTAPRPPPRSAPTTGSSTTATARFGWSRNTGGMDDALIATFELDDDELLVSVNSDERMAEAVALLAAVLPDARLIDHDERTARGDGDVARSAPRRCLRRASPMEDHERRWVDEPVPALHGLTPREALDDPVERVALERLIDGMRHRPTHPAPAWTPTASAVSSGCDQLSADLRAGNGRSKRGQDPTVGGERGEERTHHGHPGDDRGQRASRPAHRSVGRSGHRARGAAWRCAHRCAARAMRTAHRRLGTVRRSPGTARRRRRTSGRACGW